MSEETKPEKTEVVEVQEGETFLSVPLDQELDEEALDQFLADQDPEFAAQMKVLAQDKALVVEDIVYDDAEQELFEEIQRWQNSAGSKRIFYKILPFLPRLSLWGKKTYRSLSVKAVALSIIARNTAHDLALSLWRGTLRTLRETRQGFKQQVSGAGKSFKRMSGKRKLLLLLTLLFLGGLSYTGYLVLTGRFMPKPREIFIANFEDMGAEVFDYDPNEPQEFFYNNVRSAPNLLLIPKIIVNIRPSANSGPNPMLAVEFFADGIGPDVILEMKEREPMLRDQIQRRLEDFNFDVLDTPQGKQEMTQALLRDLNRSLTQGQLRALRIKTIVLKY